MNKFFKNITIVGVLAGLLLVNVACEPELNDLSLELTDDELLATGIDASGVVDGEPVEGASGTITEPEEPTGVAMNAAVILNGDLEYFSTVYPTVNASYAYNKDDENDIWEASSNSTLKDGSAAPFVNSNSDLKSNAGVKAAGMSSGSYEGDFALKFAESVRVAYQAFEVEPGITYTIKFFVDGENGAANDLTVYMLNNEVSDESDLTGNSDEVYVATTTDAYVEHSFTFTATSSIAVFYAKPNSTIDGDSEIWLDNISVETPGFGDDDGVEVVMADDAAEIINGDLEYFSTIYPSINALYVYNKDDENDIWEASSNSTLKDGSSAPFGNSNSDLKSNAGVKAAGMSSGSYEGDFALKFAESVRVAYQSFEVKAGVTYTIKFWLDGENGAANDLTVYMLNNEVADESDLSGNSDVVYVGTTTDAYVEHSFTFTATTSIAVFYAKPNSTIDGDSEIWIDNISVETPGF